MAKKSKKKEECRRLSVRERTQNKKDVASWVDTTQPSRKAAEPVLPVVSKRPYESEESLLTDETDLIEEPRRLDGGYGWFIVFFSFVLHFIADGLTFSFGQMFHIIVLKFNVNRLAAGLVASCFLSAPLFFSPIAGVIGEQLGCRLQLAGGLSLALAGIFVAGVAMFFGSIWSFFFGFSGLLAIGLALVYNGAIVIVNLYFSKKAGLATSLAVAGTGAGTIAFPLLHILFDYLVEENSALIMMVFTFIAVLVALIICIFTIRDVEWSSDEIEYKKRMFERNLRKLNNERPSDEYELEDEPQTLRRCVSLPCVAIMKELRGSIIDLGTSMQSVRETVSMTKQAEPPVPRSRSVGTFMKRNLAVVPEYTMLKADDFVHLDHLDLHLGHSPANTIHIRPATRMRMLSKTSMSVDAIADMTEDEISDRKCFSDSEDDIDDDSEAESDSDLSNDGLSSESELSDKVLKGKKEPKETKTNGAAAVNGDVVVKKVDSNRMVRPSVTVVNQAPGRVLVGRTDYRIKTNTNLLAWQVKMPSAPLICPKKKKWHERNKQIRHIVTASVSLAQQFPTYWRLMKHDTACRTFVYSVSLLYTVLDVPYVSFYDHAVETLQMSKAEGCIFTSIIGGSSLISTILIGLASNQKRFQEIMFYFNGLAMYVLAGAIFFAGNVTAFKDMALICGVLGTFLSSNYVLQSVMLTQLFPDANKFAVSYAMVSMFQGAATFIGPPIIGLIRDYTGEYKNVYYISAVVLFFSGIASFYCGYLEKKGVRGRSTRSPSKSSRSPSANGETPLLKRV